MTNINLTLTDLAFSSISVLTDGKFLQILPAKKTIFGQIRFQGKFYFKEKNVASGITTLEHTDIFYPNPIFIIFNFSFKKKKE